MSRRVSTVVALLLMGAVGLAGCLPGDGAPAAPSSPEPPPQTAAAAAPDSQSGNTAESAGPASASADPQAETDTGAAPAAGANATPDAPATDTTETTETVPAVDARIYLEPRSVRQGSAFLLAVDAPAAGAVSVAFEGTFISLIREGDRFFTVLPVHALAEPGPAALVVAVADGAGRIVLNATVTYEIIDAAWEVENLDLTAENEALLDAAVVAEDQALRDRVQRRKSPQRLWDGWFRLPTRDGLIASVFGSRRAYNGVTSSDYHSGLDFAAALGADVLAPTDGIVIWVGETVRRGRGVIVDHGGGVFTAYWHLSAAQVQAGAPVARGQVIALVGNTGLSTGPHLHFEVVVHGVPVDPLQWLREREIPSPGAAFDPARALNAPGASDGAASANGTTATDAAETQAPSEGE